MRQRSGLPKASRPIFCSNYAWLLSLTAAQLHHPWHSFASRALALGETLPVISKLLGHTSAYMTARCAHHANDPVKSAANRIANRIAKVSGSVVFYRDSET